MDLGPTPDQRAIKEAFAAVFAEQSNPERVRAAQARGFDPELWGLLVELGAVGISVGEDAGGAGTGMLELVLVAEEAGRRVACVPFVEAAVGARVLERTHGPAQLLERALDGGLLAVFTPSRATDGVARLAVGGAIAGAVIALDGDELVLVEGPVGAGVDDLGFVAVADRPLTGDDVTRHVLAEGTEAEEQWRRARSEWQLGTAALLIGLAHQSLAIGAQYAVERWQFGVPIGSFQALQQQLAAWVTAAEGGELLTREAGWMADHDVSSWGQVAAMAYAHAAESAVGAAEAALHVHGGYGYTLEYDIQLYLRRAKGLALADDDTELVWEEIGAAVVASRS